MEFEKKIRAYLQEAGIYQDQALFDEARKRYSQAMAMLKKVPGVKNREKIIGLVTKKINHLNQAYAYRHHSMLRHRLFHACCRPYPSSP